MRKGQNPRLQFTDAEREDSRLKEHIRHADQAADKAEAARAKISKKKKKVKQRTVDPATGKKKTQLRFEEVDKPAPASKLTHAVTAAPGKTISSQVHKKIGETEEDNVGVQSVHQVEEAAESGVHMAQSAYRSHKLRPYRAAARAERKLEKANVNALYQKSLAENPALSSNPISRWQQKQAIKKQYAAAKRTGQSANAAAKAAENTAKATKKAAEETKKAGGFVWRHRRGFGIVLALFLMVCAFANGLSSCSVLLQGGLSGVAGSTYPCRDEDMLGAEDAYAQMEADLQYELDHYESIHSGYDEYHYDLDEIEHDPYVLMSILTAYHQGEWTLSQVQGTLAMLFDKQYTLTETVVVETRYRTETSTDPETGETTSEEVPYDYYICYVTLDNFDLSHLPVYIMGEDQVSMYAVYMATLGNRPDLFPQSEYPNASTRQDYLDYDVPPEAWKMKSLPPCLRRQRNTWAIPMCGAAAPPAPALIAAAS